MVEGGGQRGGVAGHFARLWSERDLRRILVTDMAVNGTMLNVGASVVAIGLLAADLHPALAVAVHFAPLPYNVFLMAAVWRAADGNDGLLAALARPLSVGWMLATVVV